MKGNNHNPYFIFRPLQLEKAVQCFKNNFSGLVLYAMKANPEQRIVEALYQQGIAHFDVASLDEVARIRQWLPQADIFFMHPVKSRFAIAESYHRYGVRHFSLDSHDELLKILAETQNADDLGLHLRLSVPNTHSELNLTDKFGVDAQEAPELLRQMRIHSHKLGVCFHVGSQCMHPDAYKIAIQIAANVIKHAGVEVDYFNVGGGFPSIYPGMTPPPLTDYLTVIADELSVIDPQKRMRYLCEPGRALVAESMSVVVRVELRKGHDLYINDGTYGSLFDAGTPSFIFPTRLLGREASAESSELVPFRFFGPTCDGIDFMPGPFYLPTDTAEGDYIEVGQVGAYGKTMSTCFNGFQHHDEIITDVNKPLMSLYDEMPLNVALKAAS